MDIDFNMIISITGVLISISGFLLAYVRYIRGQEKRIVSLEERNKDFGDMKKKLDTLVVSEEDKGERLKALEVKIELFWQAVQSSVIQMLKHPNTPRKDELLDRLADQTINVKELTELKELLKCSMTSKKKDGLAAALLVARIDALLYDHKVLTINSMR